MIYSNAGHYKPLWFKSEREKFILSNQRHSRRIWSRIPGRNSSVGFRDILVMYTDGVIEAKAEDGQMFGLERLTRIIEQNSSLGAHEIFEKIQAEIRDFIGKALPFDDMTLMVLRVK